MKNIILLVILCFFVHHLAGQEIKISKLKNWQLKGYLKSAERIGDNYSAIDFCTEYVKRNSKDIQYSLKLADLYFSAKNYKKAKILYKKIYKSDPKKYPAALFYYAEILKTEQKYDSAQECFLKFRQLIATQTKRDIYSYLSNIEIESCEFALKNQTPYNDIFLTHLNNSINKVNLESAPLIYNDSTLVYSSLLSDSIPIIASNQELNIPVNKFYTARFQNHEWKGEFEAPEPFYNFDNENTSNGVFSLDKQRFYFTSARRNWKNKIIGTLYVSRKKSGIWQKPVKLDERINLKKYTSTQPATGISYDRNFEVIYFISDRPGGWGGMDIWYTVYDTNSGSYKKPVNAGGDINTIGDEVTPFYDNQTKNLYFSSNALQGYGGFDIYKSSGWLLNWTPAENVGLPLNSSYDDIYYTKFMDKETGFVVSNRDGALFLRNPNCCFDIFEFSIADIQKIVKNQDYVEINKIYNKNNTNDSLSGIKLIKHSIDSTLIAFGKEKKLTNNSSDNTVNKVKENTSYISNTNNSDKFYSVQSNLKSFNFSNIYFEFNNSVLTSESKSLIDSTLLVIMKEYPNIVVEIGAHTDHLGGSTYNLELSKKRAGSVVQYLISKGIDKERMEPIGYGEIKPLIPSIDANGNDISEAREKNRRIEFKLIGVLKSAEKSK
jgi:OmpA-OmpF porin, OOP family